VGPLRDSERLDVISEGEFRFRRIDTSSTTPASFVAKPFTKHTESRLWIDAKRPPQRLLSDHAWSSTLPYLREVIADPEEVAAIIRISGGKFCLIRRLTRR
jgi:hypothetical protein